jgi:hypothetical protein
MRITPEAAASYVASAASVAAGITLQDWGVLVGIFTALATSAGHLYFASRRDKMDEEVTKARIAEIQSHTAKG